MNRPLIQVSLTEIERDLLVECIDYRVRESDRRNMSGIPIDNRRRTGKFRFLADIRRQLVQEATR